MLVEQHRSLLTKVDLPHLSRLELSSVRPARAKKSLRSICLTYRCLVVKLIKSRGYHPKVVSTNVWYIRCGASAPTVDQRRNARRLTRGSDGPRASRRKCARRDACNRFARRDVAGDDGAGPDQRAGADRHAADHDRAGPDARAILDAVRRSVQSASRLEVPSLVAARGVLSLTNTAPWPTKTPSPSSTPSQMNVWLWILHLAPTIAPRWISTNGPTASRRRCGSRRGS